MAWLLVVIVAILGALSGPLFRGAVYTGDDLGAYHLPVRAFYADALQHGHAFDWMPSLFNGFYLTGEGQAGVYHSLHWVLYRWLPLSIAFDLEVLLPYPLLLLGMFLFLRRIVASPLAALWGALFFSFSSFAMLHFIQTNAVAVVAHLPWLLWAIDIALRETRPRRRAAAEGAIALLTASQILTGYPQYVWFSLLAESAFAIYTAGWQRRLGWVLLMKGLGCAIAAVQWLPTLAALQDSTRGEVTAQFLASGSLAPLNVIQLVAPYLFASRVVGQNTHELGIYCGSLPLLLTVWLLANRAAWGASRRLILGLLVFGAVATLLCLGDYGWLYPLQRWLPGVGRFRFPCRAIVLVQFTLAMLAAIALSIILRREREPWLDRTESRHSRGRRFGPLAAVVASSILAALLGPVLWPRQIAAAPLVWAGPLLLFCTAGLLLLWLQGRRWAAMLLIGLSAIDAGTYGLSYGPVTQHAALAQFATPSNPPPSAEDGGHGEHKAALDLMSQTQIGQRIGDRILLAGWARVDGYAGLEPARQLDYHSVAALRVAGAQWVLRSALRETTKETPSAGPLWQRIRDPLPRAKLYGRAVVSTNPATDIEQIDLASTALVSQPVELAFDAAASVTPLVNLPGRLTFQVTTAGPQLLGTTESWHSGWRATLDDRPLAAVRVNGDFLGAVVPPGQHQIAFQFQPASLKAGKIVTCYGLCLLGLLAIWRSRRPRARPTTTATHNELQIYG
ncbi:MAG TPA: YfhO family protein [Pirellulales bacterium]|nr:YfhO family protein [Pirellulales bacterium]